MCSLGGSLIGELDYHETFELYYFFLEKVFFFQRVAVAVYTQPLSICKELAKRKIKKRKVY